MQCLRLRESASHKLLLPRLRWHAGRLQVPGRQQGGSIRAHGRRVVIKTRCTLTTGTVHSYGLQKCFKSLDRQINITLCREKTHFGVCFFYLKVSFFFSLESCDRHTSPSEHSLRVSRCWMATECEKGTSSSVYRAPLSTHPFSQWPHWGWAQVKAYLKGLFNTEKWGHIPEPQGRGTARGRESDSSPLPPHAFSFNTSLHRFCLCTFSF